MENFSIILNFSVFYSVTCISLQFLLPCPKSLIGHDKRDYIGQHVSMLHSIIATLLSLFIYIQEGGVDYNAKTTENHVSLLSVKFI